MRELTVTAKILQAGKGNIKDADYVKQRWRWSIMTVKNESNPVQTAHPTPELPGH